MRKLAPKFSFKYTSIIVSSQFTHCHTICPMYTIESLPVFCIWLITTKRKWNTVFRIVDVHCFVHCSLVLQRHCQRGKVLYHTIRRRMRNSETNFCYLYFIYSSFPAYHKAYKTICINWSCCKYLGSFGKFHIEHLKASIGKHVRSIYRTC